MRQLTNEQKKIIYIALIVLGFLLLFWLFVYAPQARRVASIKERLTEAEAQIIEINRITQGRQLSEAVRDLEVQLKKAETRLPQAEATVISSLSEAAKKLKIEVKGLGSVQKRPVPDRVTGYDIEELPITMKLDGEFRAIGEYLDILRNESGVLIRLRQLNIQSAQEAQPYLEANLQISAYLSKEN